MLQNLDQYADWLYHLITSQVVLAPLLLLLVEEAGVPIFIPGDAVLTYTGFRLSTAAHTPLWLAFAVAMIAVAAGSTLLFFAARHWGQTLIENLGRYLFIKEKHLRRGEKLFAKYGIWAIFFGRHLPGMRVPITILAAASGIRYSTFIATTIASTSWWVLVYLSLGQRFGDTIRQHIRQYVGTTVTLAIIAAIVIIGLHLWRSNRRHRRERD